MVPKLFIDIKCYFVVVKFTNQDKHYLKCRWKWTILSSKITFQFMSISLRYQSCICFFLSHRNILGKNLAIGNCFLNIQLNATQLNKTKFTNFIGQISSPIWLFWNSIHLECDQTLYFLVRMSAFSHQIFKVW